VKNTGCEVHHYAILFTMSSCLLGQSMLPVSSSFRVLWNVGILPQHFTASQFRKPRVSFQTIIVTWCLSRRHIVCG